MGAGVGGDVGDAVGGGVCAAVGAAVGGGVGASVAPGGNSVVSAAVGGGVAGVVGGVAGIVDEQTAKNFAFARLGVGVMVYAAPFKAPSVASMVQEAWPTQDAVAATGTDANSPPGSSRNSSPPQLPPTLPTAANTKHSMLPEPHVSVAVVPSFWPAGYSVCAQTMVRAEVSMLDGHMYDIVFVVVHVNAVELEGDPPPLADVDAGVAGVEEDEQPVEGTAAHPGGQSGFPLPKSGGHVFPLLSLPSPQVP